MMGGWLLLLGFVLSAFFSGVETGSYTLNRVRLRRDVLEKRGSAIRLERLLRHPHRFVFTMLIGNNLAIYLVSLQTTRFYLDAGVGSGGLVAGFLPWNAETAATLTLMVPLFLLAEMWPKSLFRAVGDGLMRGLSVPIGFVMGLFFPLAWPLERLFRLFVPVNQTGRLGWDRFSKGMLLEQLAWGRQQGVISSYQSRMMDHVIEMHRVPVRILMRPLRKSLTLGVEATVGDLRGLCGRRSGAEVLLIEGQRAVGLVQLEEVLKRRLGDEVQLLPLAQDVLSIEVNRNIKSAFYRLRRNPQQVAAVVDGRGILLGSLRIEDIARYIAKR